MLPRKKCPRCGKGVAKLRNDALARHKNEDGLWCSGTAKTRNELVIDLVGAVTAERDALREYTDELLRHSEEVVRIINKHAAAQAVSVEIMHQITAAYESEVARLESANQD